MGALDTPGQLRRGPLPRYAGGPGGPRVYHAVAAVTLEHDLPPVLDLPHIRPESDGHITDLNEIQRVKIRPIIFN